MPSARKRRLRRSKIISDHEETENENEVKPKPRGRDTKKRADSEEYVPDEVETEEEFIPDADEPEPEPEPEPEIEEEERERSPKRKKKRKRRRRPSRRSRSRSRAPPAAPTVTYDGDSKLIPVFEFEYGEGDEEDTFAVKRRKTTKKAGGGVDLHIDFLIDNATGMRPVEVYTCHTHAQITAGIDILRTKGNPCLVGLDCEWNNHFIERGAKVALTQIGSTRVVLLIPMLNHETFPEALVDLLEDESVKKTGIGIAGDVSRLAKDYDLTVNGVTDIKDFKQFGLEVFEYGLNKRTLEYMALGQGHESWKNKKAQMSRWSRDPLNMSQKVYAAKDALYSARIWWGLFYLKMVMDVPPGKPKGFDDHVERPARLAAEAAAEKLRIKEEKRIAREAKKAAVAARKKERAEKAAAAKALKAEKAAAAKALKAEKAAAKQTGKTKGKKRKSKRKLEDSDSEPKKKKQKVKAGKHVNPFSIASKKKTAAKK